MYKRPPGGGIDIRNFLIPSTDVETASMIFCFKNSSYKLQNYGEFFLKNGLQKKNNYSTNQNARFLSNDNKNQEDGGNFVI